ARRGVVLLERLARPARPFFFSSRRRHTRFSRDWSSDVCSSDLRRIVCDVKEGHDLAAGERFGIIRFGSRLDVYLPQGAVPLVARSEERRVGKESGYGWIRAVS